MYVQAEGDGGGLRRREECEHISLCRERESREGRPAVQRIDFDLPRPFETV